MQNIDCTCCKHTPNNGEPNFAKRFLIPNDRTVLVWTALFGYINGWFGCGIWHGIYFKQRDGLIDHAYCTVDVLDLLLLDLEDAGGLGCTNHAFELAMQLWIERKKRKNSIRPYMELNMVCKRR